MQWRDDREGKFMGGFMVSLQAHRLCRFYSLQTLFSCLSPPVQREDTNQQDFCMDQGEEYLVSNF